MLIDTHAHLTMSEFSDLPDVVKRAKEAGVGAIINAGFDLECSKDCVKLADQYDLMYAGIGIHPHHADTAKDNAILELKELAKNKKVVAIGETGLDYYENQVPKDIQKQAFIKHILFAKESGLPLIFHGRDSAVDMLEIIREYGKGSIKGVFHCFSEDEKYAQKVLDMGFYISFTAIITFKNANSMRETAKYIPLDRIMIETDCPYLAPQIYRGKRNEPSYVKLIADKLAEIKQVSPEIIEEKTTSNAKSLFKI